MLLPWCAVDPAVVISPGESPKVATPSTAVGDAEVHLHEPADAPCWQSGEGPHPPQWPRPVQSTSHQLFGDTKQLGLVTRRRDLKDLDVFAEIEPQSIYPERPALLGRRDVEELPEPGLEVRPRAPLWSPIRCALSS